MSQVPVPEHGARCGARSDRPPDFRPRAGPQGTGGELSSSVRQRHELSSDEAMRCSRCGHGFAGTASHGSRRCLPLLHVLLAPTPPGRHDPTRTGSRRSPCSKLVHEALVAADDGTIFEQAARTALEVWHAAHPEPSGTSRESINRVERRTKAIERDLRAFDAGRAWICSPMVTPDP